MLVARLAWLSFGSVLPAQVFVVDIGNGPGTSFTSLVTAVATVPDGATLVVRPGAYPGPVVVDGKGLAILGTPFATISTGGLRIQNTAASQPNTVSSLAVASTMAPTPIVQVSNCAGRVVLESVVASSAVTGISAPTTLVIGGAQQVAVRNSVFSGGAFLSSSHVAAEASSFTGLNAFWSGAMSGAGSYGARSAILLGAGSMLQLVHSTVQGGAGACHPFGCGGLPPLPQYANKPALELAAGSTVIVRAPGMLSGGATFAQGAAITGTGTVRIDPAVTINGAVAVSPPAQLVAMPSMRSTSAALGGTLTATANGRPGSLLLLLLGLPGPALSVPGIADPFWMDPNGHMYAAIGATQPLTASLAVPISQPLLGFAIAWQTVAFDPAVGLLASQPSIAFVF